MDCIKTGDKPESGGDEGLKVVEILEAASESLKRDGAQVEISEIAQRNLTWKDKNNEILIEEKTPN